MLGKVIDFVLTCRLKIDTCLSTLPLFFITSPNLRAELSGAAIVLISPPSVQAGEVRWIFVRDVPMDCTSGVLSVSHHLVGRWQYRTFGEHGAVGLFAIVSAWSPH